MRLAIAVVLFASAAHASVTGLIVDENAKPVAGATVREYPSEPWRSTARRYVTGTVERPVLASAQTADDGSFRIDVKAPLVDLVIEANGLMRSAISATDGNDLNVIVLRPAKSQKLRVLAGAKAVPNASVIAGSIVSHTDAEGMVEYPDTQSLLVIMHPDYAPFRMFVSSDDTKIHDLQLTRGEAIRGRVLAADGQAVAHATITIRGWPLAESAADGTFTIAHAPANWRMLVAYEGSRAGSAMNKRASSYDIKLAPAATISGSAPPGTRVMFVQGQEADSPDDAIADAQGKYASPPLLPGRYTVRAFRRDASPANADVTVAAGAVATRDLKPKPLAVARGRVIDEQNQPVAGAFVGSTIGMMVRQSMVMTNAKGEFAATYTSFFNRQPAMVALKAGYAAGTATVGSGPVTITLPRGFPLEVKVIDRQRKTVSGATVSVASGAMDNMVATHTEAACEQPLSSTCRTTDDAGTVRLRATEGEYAISVRGESIVNKNAGTQQLTAKSSPVTVEVDRGVEVSGRVVYPDGTPVSDAFVHVQSMMGSSGRTENDGTFVIRNLLPGKIAVVASTTQQPSLQSAPVEVDAPVRGVVITMPETARIEGRVVDKDTSQPITDFQIAYTNQPRTPFFNPGQNTHSDDGSFVLDRVPIGTIRIQVGASGYARATLGDLTTESGKTLRAPDVLMERGGTVRGHVTAGGDPASGVGVQFGDTRGAMFPMQSITSTVTDDNGDYTIEGIAVGDRTIRFQKQGLVPLQKNVQIERGKEARLDVDLSRGRELQGKVVDSTGRPVRGVRVSAMPVAGGGSMPVTTDEAGSFTIAGLADGRYRVSAQHEGYVNAELPEVTVPSEPLTLTLQTGGSVSGRIVGLTPAELAATEVSISGSGTYAHGTTNADGTFTVRGVADGTNTIYGWVRGGVHPRQSLPQKIEVVNGSTASVQIDFSQGLTVTGRVTRSGMPLTQGNVNFSGPTGSRGSAVAADGTYQVDGLAAGDYTVTVYALGSTIWRGTHSVSSTSTLDIQITGATLHGRVVDASNQSPISDVMVTTTGTKENPVPRQSMSDSDGRFTLEAIPDGPVEIRAMPHDRYASSMQTVTISNGTAPDVEFRLDTAQPSVFRVVDGQSGAPLDAFISVMQNRKQIAMSRGPRDDDNGIRVYVASGTYDAIVTSRGYILTRTSFTAPNADVRVTMMKAGRMVVMASRPTKFRFVHAPEPGVGGVIGGVVSSAAALVATPSGMPIDNLTPGTYTVMALDDSGKVVKSVNAVVTSGQTTTVSVD